MQKSPPREFKEWTEHADCALLKAGEGFYAEFGVYKGGSLTYFLDKTRVHFHAFDSFMGLPEAWLNNPVGHLNLDGAEPDLPLERVTLHKGMFEFTVPQFAEGETKPAAFLHIDCDLYSSTKTVLIALAKLIVAGTVIVFDEFVTGVASEKDAFLEFCRDFGRDFDYLSAHKGGGSVAVVMK